jgi:malate dehydrogenase
MGDIISSIASQDGRIWPASASLEGEYGLRDVSIGVPVRVGPKGIEEIIEIPLDPDERQALEASAASIKEMIRDGERLLADAPMGD